MRKVGVVLCWHLHQPDYRGADGEFRQPWVYLHAIKDYADMAWHLECVPDARAVVNFTAPLIDQLQDYTDQFERRVFRDPLLRALRSGDADTLEQRRALDYMLCRANYHRLVLRFPVYERLFHLAETAAWGGEPLSARDREDALVWYHLVWLGEASRRNDERVKRLIAKARDYDASDRAMLLDIIGELVRGIIPRYRALGEAGRIELAASPYSHPIVPLLIDFRAARDALPDIALPAGMYPGGVARADAQIAAGRERHRQVFGNEPEGCWPPEGGISSAALAAFARGGYRWAASGEGVLENSRRASFGDPGVRETYLYTPHTVGEGTDRIACFFRDDDLSDRIGFIYANWEHRDAVDDLVSTLERIEAATAVSPSRTVTIVLDGENAWEHYPDNAYHLLSGIYERLSSHPSIGLTTFSAALAATQQAPVLPRVVAGSWVFATFITWIGDPDKNRGWELLCAAKAAYDRALASGRLTPAQRERAEMRLRDCEASDWFWWFGGYNPASSVADFERLFRTHIRDLYDVLGEAAPAELDVPVSRGLGTPVYDGVMRPAREPKTT